jgi:hypothetical protein
MNLFGQILQKASAPPPRDDSRMIVVRITLPVRQAIWFLIADAEKTVWRTHTNHIGRRSGRLSVECLRHDDGPGYSQLVLHNQNVSQDEFDALVLREAAVMAYKRMRPGLPAPTPEASDQMRVLIGQLDEWLGTPAVERIAALGLGT